RLSPTLIALPTAATTLRGISRASRELEPVAEHPVPRDRGGVGPARAMVRRHAAGTGQDPRRHPALDRPADAAGSLSRLLEEGKRLARAAIPRTRSVAVVLHRRRAIGVR